MKQVRGLDPQMVDGMDQYAALLKGQGKGPELNR